MSSQVSSSLSRNAQNILRKRSEGSVYRSNLKPPKRPLVIDKDLSVSTLLNKGFKQIPTRPKVYEYVQPLDGAQVPIATLSHGLERALFSSGVHRLRDPVTNQYNFPPYLEKLHHPDTIDYDKMPPFKTPSVDEVLLFLDPILFTLSPHPTLKVKSF